jgi:CRP-like cAMP-binding protein
MLGEMSLVDEAPPSATVVVTEPTHVLHIDHSALNAKLDIDPYFAARLYRAIAVFRSMRMRSTVQQLGYGKAAAFGEDEIDMSFLDSVTLAGSRFDRLVKKLLTA